MESDQRQQRDRRPEALGDLRVLPDELFCPILDRLSPRDLGRLSCVSSVMYILCNEEPLWMNLCLRVAGPLEYKVSWKKTMLYRQNLSTKVSEPHEKPLKFDGFNSLFLYRRWYRCFATLETFSMDKGDLERKKDMSLGEFYANYDVQKPVLLTDLANTWPARNTWTIDQLVQKYGETAFRISQRSSKKITMKFKDYVSYMYHQHDEDPLYIFDDKFAEAAPSLLNDYSVPFLFREDFFDVLDEEQRPSFRWLIIGPERSGASWHVDPALTSAWNTLLLGRKRWALYPPGKVPVGVTVHVNEEDGDVDVESPSSLQWWLDIYPLLADEDKPLECTQLPGETIFVPSGWWHCVLNLETTIAITQNFVNTSNFQFVCLDMSPGHLHKGVSRAGWLAVQDKFFKNVKEASLDVDQLNYVDMTRKEKRAKLLKPAEKQRRYNRSENDDKSTICNDFYDWNFSYDIDFLSKFLKDERDHYNSIWTAGNCIGQREFRQWLHKLWVMKPGIRQLVWKGACLALKADKWLECMMEICSSHNLPSPLDNERLPVGTGSNPVFLVSDYVIKIYVEGGLESSLYSLGTELEFHSLLHKLKSPLIKHVPAVFASGIVIHEDGFYKSYTWDGRGVPDLITNFALVDGSCLNDGFHFGVWRKMTFELRKEVDDSCSRICPYLITKRCKGDIFANLRDALSMDDVLNLASFLGNQLHNLHLLPLPSLQIASHLKGNGIHFTKRVFNYLDKGYDIFRRQFVHDEISESIRFSPEWEPFVAALERRKSNLHTRLVQWGDPIPRVLIDRVEEYIPHDPALLLMFKDEDGLYKARRLPSWIHSDIMDDNIHLEQCSTSHCFSQTTTFADSISDDAKTTDNVEESLNRWCPAHILDFGNLFIGDPICDLIPIHIDVFRGDSVLLRRFLESYKVHFGRKSSDETVRGRLKFERVSYQAMCYCILHEENILGAIFSLWADLKGATSWEEVEEAVWGELNNYQLTD
uniref:F-box protein At1g78280 n=1 Tax=Anthurium amnicola TaxID=1678845 RepID=A0A1D1Z0D8_9ARAE